MKARCIFLSIIILSIVQSCWYAPLNCDDIKPYFDITGINFEGRFFSENTRYPVSATDLAIDFEDFYLSLSFDKEYISSINTNGTLLADDCRDNGHEGTKPEEGPDTLYFITLKDFNNTYAANDTINDIIHYRWLIRYPEHLNDTDELESFIKTNDESILNSYYDFKITEQPDFAQQQFKIVFLLDNGELYEDTTSVIKFN